jgi:hypothetical protein
MHQVSNWCTRAHSSTSPILGPPKSCHTAAIFRCKRSMPIANQSAATSEEIFKPECRPLLLGCALLASFLCLPIILYTNQVKRTATMLAPVFSSPNTAAETNTVRDLGVAGALQDGVAVAQKTDGDSISSEKNPRAVIALSQESLSDQKGDGSVTSSKPESRKRNRLQARTALPRRSEMPAVSKSWARIKPPRHAQAALIAIWRRTFRTTAQQNH